MNILDIVILVVILAFVIRGITRGLISELGTIFGIIIAFMISTRLVGTIGSFFIAGIKLPPVAATVLSYILTFAIVLVAYKLVLGVIVRIIHSTPLDTIDTIGGGLIGLFFGALLLSIIFVVLSIFPFSKKWVYGQETSKLYPYIIKVAPTVYNVYGKISSRNQSFYDEFAFLKKYITEEEPKETPQLHGTGLEIFQQLKKMNPEQIQKQIDYFKKLEEGKGSQQTPFTEALRLLKADTSSTNKKSLDDMLKDIK